MLGIVNLLFISLSGCPFTIHEVRLFLLYSSVQLWLQTPLSLFLSVTHLLKKKKRETKHTITKVKDGFD